MDAGPIIHILKHIRTVGQDDIFVSRLLDPTSPFSGADHALFNSLTLRVHQPLPANSRPSLDAHLNKADIQIWNPVDSLMGQFFTRFGRNLRNITVLCSTNPDVSTAITCFLRTLGLTLNANLPISTVSQLMNVLKSIKQNLVSISLRGQMPGLLYAERFFVAVRGITNLKEVRLGRPLSRDSAGIWRYIGRGLEVIYTDFDMDVQDQTWADILRNIVVYCPKLAKIYFGLNFPRSGENAVYKSFLRVYNTQLLHAPYGSLAIADLSFLVEICTNNRVSWPPGTDAGASRFEILRLVLETIHLSTEINNNGVLEARQPGILSPCKSVLSITVHGRAIYGVKHLFGPSIFPY